MSISCRICAPVLPAYFALTSAGAGVAAAAAAAAVGFLVSVLTGGIVGSLASIRKWGIFRVFRHPLSCSTIKFGFKNRLQTDGGAGRSRVRRYPAYRTTTVSGTSELNAGAMCGGIIDAGVASRQGLRLRATQR